MQSFWECVPPGTALSTASPNYKLRIVGDVAFLQQRNELILEGMFGVMFGLMLDALANGFPIGVTHTQCSIKFLPAKSKPCSPSQREELALRICMAFASGIEAGGAISRCA